eukprot:TRINITY_DN467_c4_g1_i2.p1 TRINITY_DN467_c4_g1~~TRINITY_DN467_c4_g1_i2.p1  ORF type:complete len:146 (+),score=31.83 TRINITY_DN467_c4_g1_i2:97-534(+)
MANNNKDIRYFFVYGTLREDDEQNSPWRDPFNKDMISVKAKLPSSKLYCDTYPCIDFTDDPNDVVVGCLVTPDEDHKDDEFWNEKLISADKVEDYPNWYNRKVVEAIVTENKGKYKVDDKFPSFVYYREDFNREDLIESGDWTNK